jgi:GWxTD domain-containing protein
VADSAGKALTTTAPSKVTVPAGGGVLKGQLDLSGLPPGRYTMTAELDIGGKRVERAATFSMAGLDETLEKDVARRDAVMGTDEGYFDAMNEEQLKDAKEPLMLIAASGELSKYTKELSLRAKRKFLTEFWQRHDQTPETPANESRQRFYDAVAYADKKYGEKGRASVPGWKTDRGRIYVRNGAPDETLERRSEGRAVPYEVWHYTRGKNRYYIFADRSSGLGVYQLIFSNDVKENTLPNWREILHKQEAVIDIERFLGVNLRSSSMAQ